MKVNAKNLLKKTKQEGRALPAFNVSSIEALKSVFEVAGKSGEPVIIETSKGESTHLMPKVLTSICKTLSDIHNVHYILHMDRCDDFDWMKRVLDAGYNSISAEFKSDNLQDIIEKSQKARELTNEYNAQLEGVMDIVPLVYYVSDRRQNLTNVDQAAEFIKEVQPDSFVVSVGTQSGRHKSIRDIRYDILEELNTLNPNLPFVLHGGSFLDSKIVQRLIKLGITKININSELRIAYTEKLKRNIQTNPDEYAPYRLLNGIEESMKKIILSKINLFNNINN